MDFLILLLKVYLRMYFGVSTPLHNNVFLKKM